MAFDPEDPDTKAALKTAVEEAITDATAKLDAKNKELIAELREAKKGKTIDPAEVERLETQRDDLQTKLTAALRAGKDATTAAEKATKALEAEQTVTHKLIAENGLVAELTKAGVTDPAYLDASKALHLGQIKVVAVGDERKALYGDKPLADAIKEWAGSDVGKKFVAAPVNGGGGAGGGKTGETGKTMTRTEFDAADGPAKVAFAKEGGKVVDAAT